MYPDLFTLNLPVIGELTITSFGVSMALAFLAGWWIIRHEVRRHEHDEELAADILIACLIGGLVGARIFYVLLNWDRFEADPFGTLFARGGLVWYGGFFGGMAGILYVVRTRKQRLGTVLDYCAPALPVSYAIGRLGCFLVGDDYGRPTDSWYGVAFPEGLPPTTAGNLRASFGERIDPAVPDHEVLAVHPTQLYEIGLSAIVFALIWRWRDRPRRAGWLFGGWMLLYGIQRFLIEFVRAKDDRWFGPLTVAQLLSLLLVAIGIWVLRSRAAGPSAEEAREAAARA